MILPLQQDKGNLENCPATSARSCPSGPGSPIRPPQPGADSAEYCLTFQRALVCGVTALVAAWPHGAPVLDSWSNRLQQTPTRSCFSLCWFVSVSDQAIPWLWLRGLRLFHGDWRTFVVIEAALQLAAHWLFLLAHTLPLLAAQYWIISLVHVCPLSRTPSAAQC